MNIASEEATVRFLEGIWFRWGQRIVQRIADIYELSDEQRDAFETILLPTNGWNVQILRGLPCPEKEETHGTTDGQGQTANEANSY